jgi:tRNA A-37 threonylcarbamoyl transferase component Bud32
MIESICIQPEFASLLRSRGLKSFDDFFQFQSGNVTSRHRDRETLRISVETSEGARTFYLKRVRRMAIGHCLRDLIRLQMPRPQPRREWGAIHTLKQKGIGVMAAAAVGWRSTFGLPRQSFLLVHAVPADETLQDRLSQNHLPADLIRSLGRFVRRLHRADLANPDLVPKHIFIAPNEEPDDPFRFFLIDVERLESATPRKTRRDLMHLFRAVIARSVKRTDLLRFAMAYADASGTRSQRRGILSEHFAFARSEWQRLTRSARRPVLLPDDMLAADDLDFTRYGNVVALSRFADLIRDHDLQDMSAWDAFGQQIRLDKPRLKSWRTRKRILLHAGGEDLTLYVKRFVRPPIGEQIKRIVTGRAGTSTAAGEWRNIKQLTADRVATMTPFAYGENMVGPIERDSLFSTLAVPGESLERWLPEHLAPDATTLTTPQRRFFLRQLAYFVAGFHDVGAIHRDLYLSHIYLSYRQDGQPAFRLIDLQRVFRPRFRRRRWIVKDLAALHYSTASHLVSKTERLRWLRDYLTPEEYGHRRQWITAVLNKTRQMVAHNLKHARPDPSSETSVQQPATQLP